MGWTSIPRLHPWITTVQTLVPDDVTMQRRMAAPVSGIFWLHFCRVGGSGDVLSIFIYSLFCKHTVALQFCCCVSGSGKAKDKSPTLQTLNNAFLCQKIQSLVMIDLRITDQGVEV